MTTLEQDQYMMEENLMIDERIKEDPTIYPDITSDYLIRKRFVLTYRIEQKKIIRDQVEIAEFVIEILEKAIEIYRLL